MKVDLVLSKSLFEEGYYVVINEMNITYALVKKSDLI